MPSGAGLSEEVTAIRDQLRRASLRTAPLVRVAIEQAFGTILSRVTADDTIVVEGARVMSFLFLHDLERKKASAGSSLTMALRSLDNVERLTVAPL